MFEMRPSIRANKERPWWRFFIGSAEQNEVLCVGVEQIHGLRLHQQVSGICVLNYDERRRVRIQKDHPTRGAKVFNHNFQHIFLYPFTRLEPYPQTP